MKYNSYCKFLLKKIIKLFSILKTLNILFYSCFAFFKGGGELGASNSGLFLFSLSSILVATLVDLNRESIWYCLFLPKILQMSRNEDIPCLFVNFEVKKKSREK